MAATKQQIKGAAFDLDRHEPEIQYGEYYDPTGKGRLRAAGPEEYVRQRFVKFLTSDRVKVPLDRLATEDAVSHHGSASRQRMDIVGRTPKDHPLFVVECKRMEVPCDIEENRHQVHGYAKRVRCRLAIVTNGEETCIYELYGRNLDHL